MTLFLLVGWATLEAFKTGERNRLTEDHLRLDLHTQSLGNLSQALEARRAIARGLVALNLLFFKAQPLGQLLLGQARNDAGFDQGIGRFLEQREQEATEAETHSVLSEQTDRESLDKMLKEAYGLLHW